ncbi:MAG: hypothetical protein IMZ53_00490 [Thermoplasmata archaeon]|nr:hypothetical protein [Thermoplasmata archaeon]
MKKLIFILLLLFIQCCELCQAQTQQRSTFYPKWTDTLDLGKWDAEWDSSFVRIGKFHQTRQDSILRTTINGLPLVMNAPFKGDSGMTMLRKSVLDSVKLNNVSPKYFPYHDFNKLVTSPMFTNGTSVVIEPIDSNAIIQTVIDSVGYYEGAGDWEINMGALLATRAGQTFIGNGKRLSSVQFNLERVGTHDPEMTGNCYAKLYPMSEGTSGVDGVPASDDVPIATSEPRKVYYKPDPKICLQTTHRWETFYFVDPPLLVSGTPYCIVFTFSGGDATLGWVNIATSPARFDPTGNKVGYINSWSYSEHPYTVLFRIDGISGSDSGVPDPLRHKFFVGGDTFINDSLQVNGSITLENSNRLTGDTGQVTFSKGLKVTDSLTIHGYTGGTVGSAVQGFKQSLKLGGVYNQTYNTGNSALLHISDYSNDAGDNVYPIYVEDENNNVSFYLNGGALGGVGTAYIGGALTLGSTINGFTLRQGASLSDTTKQKLKTDSTDATSGYTTLFQNSLKATSTAVLKNADSTTLKNNIFGILDTGNVARKNRANTFTQPQSMDSIKRATVNGLPLVINAPLKVDSNSIFNGNIFNSSSLVGSVLFANSNQTVVSGTVTTVHLGELIDASASFTTDMVGMTAYRVTATDNTDDGMSTTRAPEKWARITKFISSTELQLSANIFTPESSTYYVIDNHSGRSTIVSGINTTATSGKLIDASASFTAGLVGKMAIGLLDSSTASDNSLKRTTILSVDSPTQLTLASDIFSKASLTYVIKSDTINDFRYIQSAVNGFFGKSGSHYVIVSDGKYREHVLVGQQQVGTNDSYERYFQPKIIIAGNRIDNTTVKIIGSIPANDNQYIAQSIMRESIEVNGAVTCIVYGILGYQTASFIRIQSGAVVETINCSTQNKLRGTGIGFNLEQWAVAFSYNCNWTNLYHVAYLGRSNGMLQIGGETNTADSCVNLFSGGQSLAFLHTSSVLTLTGNPNLVGSSTPSGSLLIPNVTPIVGDYVSNGSAINTGLQVQDTLFISRLKAISAVLSGTITASNIGTMSAADSLHYFAQRDTNTTKNPITLSYALSNLVPFTGAGSDLNLGTHTITSGAITSSGGTFNTALNTYVKINGASGGGLQGLKIYQDATEVVNVLYNSSTGENKIGGIQSYVYPVIYSGGNPALTFATDGSATFVGTIAAQKITLDSMAYGGAYIEQSHPDSIIVTSTTQCYTIGAKIGANGYPLTSDGLLKNVTIQDSSIILGVTGTYQLNYSGDGTALNMASANKLHVHLYINNVEQIRGGAMAQVSAGNAYFVFASSTHIRTTAAGDILKVKICSQDDGSGTLIINHFNITTARIE